MKFKPARESRTQPLRSREALDQTPEPLPYETVLDMMREYKPTMETLLERHKNKITFFSYGRALLDVYPELKGIYAPTEDSWKIYKEGIKSLNQSAENRDKFSAAVALFPKHRNEIKYEGRKALDDFGQQVEGNFGGLGLYEFRVCLMLSWVREESNFRWKELMDGSWDESVQEMRKETNLPAQMTGAADLVLYRPSARAEIQQIIPHLAAVQKYLRDRHSRGGYHELPLVLRSLKIIFSKSVTADEFGRLTFEEGQRSVVSTGVPLPDRDLAL